MQNLLKAQLGLPTNDVLSQGDEYTEGYSNYQLYDDSSSDLGEGTYDENVEESAGY